MKIKLHNNFVTMKILTLFIISALAAPGAFRKRKKSLANNDKELAYSLLLANPYFFNPKFIDDNKFRRDLLLWKTPEPPAHNRRSPLEIRADNKDHEIAMNIFNRLEKYVEKPDAAQRLSKTKKTRKISKKALKKQIKKMLKKGKNPRVATPRSVKRRECDKFCKWERQTY